jgi:hypothetical protein
MANKLEKLLFAQGGLCFFCQAPLPKAEASVEHLVALANDGANSDDNCVACCKAVNGLLGSLPLKEKIKAILLQPRPFQCPAGVPQRASPTKTAVVKKTAPSKKAAASTTVSAVVENLKARKSAKPATIKTLTGSIRALQPHLSDRQIADLISQLERDKIITITNTRIAYRI